MGSYRRDFEGLFRGTGTGRPTCPEYKDFSKAWGYQKVVFDLANKTYTQIAKIKQEYAQDIFVYLTFLMHERKAEEAQEKYDDLQRRMKKGK